MAQRTILITGGAGFTGANAARRFRQQGWSVILWDNLSRPGGDKNLAWLRESGPFEFEQIDMRDVVRVNGGLAGRQPDLILHFAGQVAVTTSVLNPREDFECNALGTFNLLEAVR